jgi:hypothetical protein
MISKKSSQEAISMPLVENPLTVMALHLISRLWIERIQKRIATDLPEKFKNFFFNIKKRAGSSSSLKEDVCTSLY